MKSKRSGKRFLLILLISLGLIGGALCKLPGWSEDSDETKLQTGNYIEMTGGQVLVQEIAAARDSFLRLDAFGIAVDKGEEAVSGFLRVGLLQDGRLVQEETVSFQDMADGSYFEIPVASGVCRDGTAYIQIEYVGFEDNDTIRVLSGAEQLNLVPAALDGKELEVSCALRLSWKVAELTGASKGIRWLLMLLLPVIIAVSLYCYLYTGKRKLSLFLLGAAVFSMCALRYFELVLDCQPFAEDLNVFYASAKNLDLWENLMVKDAGYLALLQHIVTWIYFRILHLGTFTAFAMNFTALVFIAGMCLLPACKMGEQIFTKEAGFLLAIAIPAVLVRQYESFLFINAIYFAILYFFTVMTLDFRGISKLKFALHLAAAALFVLSKGFFVILFPMAAVGIWSCFKTDKKKAMWYAVIILSSVIQFAVYTLSGTQENAAGNTIVLSFSMLLEYGARLIRVLGKVLLGVFLPLRNMNSGSVFFFGLVYLGIGIAGVILLDGKKNNGRCTERDIPVNKKKNLFVGFQLVALASAAVGILTLPFLYETKEAAYSRQEFFMITALIYSLGILFCWYRKKDKTGKTVKGVYGYLITVCLVMIVQGAFEKDKLTINSPNTDAYSLRQSDMSADFKVYGPYTLKDAFYIPSNPDYWCYMENVSISLYSSPRSTRFFRSNKTDDTDRAAEQSMEQRSYSVLSMKELEWSAEGLIGIFVTKSSLQNEYIVQCLDEEGQLISSQEQLVDRRKRRIGFVFDKPVNGVSQIRFIDKNTGRALSVEPEVILVYDKTI